MLELPKGFHFTAAPSDDRKIQQSPAEWLWMWETIGPIKSFLEIGSFDGTGLLALAEAGLVKERFRTVDICNQGPEGKTLADAYAGLHRSGYDAVVCFGDSRSPQAVTWAAQWAPYDVVFIDGDHSYEAVKADWENYGPMGKIVAFHDINGAQDGCVKLWNELSATHKSACFTAAPDKQLPEGTQGVGIIYAD